MNRFLAGLLLGAVATTLVALSMWPEEPLAHSGAGAASDDREVTTEDKANPPRQGSETELARGADEPPPLQATPSDTSSRLSASGTLRASGLPSLEIPGGKLDGARAAAPAPQDVLLGAFRVRCAFGDGAGGHWPAGRLTPHTAAWQGGPIDFDAIDLSTSMARMLADSGVTGSTDGALDVRVTPTVTGLHFTAFNPRGDLLLVTVYGEHDAAGSHRAVLTMNGRGMDNESAQFYGRCAP